MIILSILSLLLSNAVNLRRDVSILYNRIAILILLYCIVHDYTSLTVVTKGIGLHGGLLLINNLTQIFHIFVFIVTIFILTLTISEYSSMKDLLFNKFIYYNTKIINKMGEHNKIIEYPLILLFIVSGAIFLMSSNDLITIFLSIELQSYGLYILSTIYRNSELSTTGGLIYFLLGGLSSCFILLGTGLLYANSGSTSLDSLYIITSISDIHNSTIIFTVGFLFKIIIGTVVGLTQFRIKRLLAYSTISHVGFMLLALSISSIESTQALIFYLTQYIISNLNAFIILLAIGYSLYCYTSDNKEHEELLDKTNSPIQLITQLKGYFFINPVLALSLTVTIFSFAGIPPLLGFFAKQMVLSAALDKGLYFITLIAILTSVIGGIYYLTIIKEMFFSKSDYKVNTLLENFKLKGNVYNNNTNIKSVEYNYKNIVLSSPIAFVISILTLTILLFLFMNKE
ncbi:NADH dehydrogenase subunit 2 [Melampsora americana]|nr:NADH dehydrogenase subunit 2 [Melampsora americana]